VADPGRKLKWIPTPQRFEFWKAIRTQIAHPEKPSTERNVRTRQRTLHLSGVDALVNVLILLEKYH
jgi:hypothetical protein